MSAFTLFVLLGAVFASAAPTCAPNNTYVHPANGDCKDYTIHEAVTSENYIYSYGEFSNNFDVAGFLFDLARKDSPTVFRPFNGTHNETASYTLEGTFCSPKIPKDGKEKTVLLATHGLGYDRRYWASSYKPEEYSFVQYALENGYSVFYYDRLGTGKSQKISGYENQAPIQTALLGKLANAIRNGSYTDKVKAEKIVLVGHSFGSFLSNVLIAQQPDIVEGAVLTGFSVPALNDTLSHIAQPYIPSIFASRIASTISPTFSDLDTGYLGFGDIYAHVETFFHKPNYEIPAAEYAQSIAQPLAVSEYLTLAVVDLVGRAAEFKGRVLTTTGEYDIIVCSGECKSTFAPEAYKDLFSGAKESSGYVHPGAGHGVNLNSNATGFYGEIVKFLDKGF